MVVLDNRNTRERVVIFVHIPKTAGTTLRYIIQYQYSPGAIYELYSPSETHPQRVENVKNLSESQKDKIKIVSGHLSFGLHEVLTQPCTYITFLRDPVDRAISMYYYCKRRNESLEDVTLEDFIQTPGRTNTMTKYISGERLKLQLTDPSKIDNYQCSSETLNLAKRNLRERFEVIGFLERFDESLLLLKKQLGWKLPLYNKHNVSKTRLYREEVSEKTIRLIENCNKLDIQLYEYAKEVFEEMIERQGSSFQQEIENFREENESSKFKYYFKFRTFFNRTVHRTYKELIKH